MGDDLVWDWCSRKGRRGTGDGCLYFYRTSSAQNRPGDLRSQHVRNKAATSPELRHWEAEAIASSTSPHLTREGAAPSLSVHTIRSLSSIARKSVAAAKETAQAIQTLTCCRKHGRQYRQVAQWRRHNGTCTTYLQPSQSFRALEASSPR